MSIFPSKPANNRTGWQSKEPLLPPGYAKLPKQQTFTQNKSLYLWGMAAGLEAITAQTQDIISHA